MAAVYQCPSPEALQRLVEDGGPAEQVEALAQHLEQCDACGKALEVVLVGNSTVSGLRSPTMGELPTGKTLEQLKERLRRLQPAADLGQARASIRFACPHCNKDLKCKPELAGKKVKCPGCGKPAAVPEKHSDAPAADINDGKTLLPAGDRAGLTMPPASGRSELERDLTIPDPTRQEHVWDFLAPPTQPGDLGQLGPYRILKVLGAGGMGVVFRAFDPHLERLVALKAMLPALAATPSAKERFFREAKAAAALKHPNVVSIFQVGEDRGAPFLAMEFLEGEPLDECLKRRGKLPVNEVLDIGRQIALGLAAAHDKGLIHRDIKPANVWLEGETERQREEETEGTIADGPSVSPSPRPSVSPSPRPSVAPSHVKILDFGLARAMGDQSHLTQSGAIIGTPAYMAPEQAAGKEVDHRCDLFSLGCALYRMCTGQMAFKGNDTISVLSSLAVDNPTSPAQIDPTIPAELSDLVMQLLDKDPAGRPASAREVAARLQELQEQSRTGAPLPRRSRMRAGKRRRVLVAACLALLLGGLIAAAVILRFGTGEGELVVQIQDPNIEVAVRQDNLTVTDKTTKREFTLKAMNGEVEVFEKDGVKLLTKKFELTRGGKTTLTVTAEELAAARKGGEPLAKTFTNSLGMEFVLVPRGKSWLGGGGGKPGDKEVEIKEDFYLGKYEVTQEEWKKVMGSNPSGFSRLGGAKDAAKDIPDAELKRFPVEFVSWDDVQLFLGLLNRQDKQESWVYRLPKDLEWEYACRGGPMADKLDSAFYFYLDKPVAQLGAEQANFDQALKRPCKVGSYPPNKLGLYDMHGNVSEWCEDFFDPKDQKPASPRVFRDGSFNSIAGNCRATVRGGYEPSQRNGYLGLRLARVPVAREIVAPPSGPVQLPHWVERKWIEGASQLPAEEQVGVVRTKLQERNPGYDGNFVFKIDDGRVVEVAVSTDKVFELSPLRAFTGLRKLDCRGSGEATSILQDLSPLQGLPLTFLNLQGCTQVYDLSPLHGLKLAELECSYTAVTNLKPLAGQPLRWLQYPHHSWLGAEPLRSIKTLETINSHPAARFWKMMDRDAAEFEKFRRSVALLSAADQVKEVTARLKTYNPDFTDTLTSTIDEGTSTVREIGLPTEHIADVSPVRAFPRLQSLNLVSNVGKSKLVDLTPLPGMKLTSLILHGCDQVVDLTPLQGMPLTSLTLSNCHQLRDLTPLRGMKLTSLSLVFCGQVRDLTPLPGMKLTSLILHGCGQVVDLTPLRGMPLTSLDLAGSPALAGLALLRGMPLKRLIVRGCPSVRDLMPLKGMKLQTLDVHDTGVQDLTLLADMPLEDLDFTPKNITRGIEVIQRMTTLKKIGAGVNHPPITPAEFWRKYKAGEFGKPAEPVAVGAAHLPHWVERKWIEDASQLPAEEQVAAVRGKLQERNPGYGGEVDFKMGGGRVVEFTVWTDKVFELSPLRAFTGLRRLDCLGSGVGKSILQDLAPLQGLPLTVLNLPFCTQVYDLSPLHGMKLAELHCASTLVTNLKPLVGQPLRVLHYPYRSWLGAEPLRSIKTLETINGQPAAAFWKIVDGEAAEFEKFRKFVALLPAADQVKEVTARLKLKNPGFTATHINAIGQDTGTIKEIHIATDHIVDLSPVRAFPRLQSLGLDSEPGKTTKLVDLTPLQGMPLTSLGLVRCDQVRDLTPLKAMPLTTLVLTGCTQVRDLTPLQGMPLTTLYLDGTQVRDLTLLQGMKLTALNIAGTQVHDLTPLKGMKLTLLQAGHSQVRDLKPLQGMPLTTLNVGGNPPVRDLMPLKGMKLQTLFAHETAVQDLTPLADMPLEELVFTPKNITKGIEVVQRMTALKKISAGANHPLITPAEFWKKYKAGEFGK